MTAPRAASGGWLFGPVSDLMLGCGGLYACVLIAFSIGGANLRSTADGALWLGPLLVLLLGTPHYGATLIRVYEDRADRRSYAIFAVYVTILLVGMFGASLFNWVIATWLVTAYLTWSPWHYAGQNYGIALMFLRRRGVDVTPTVKRTFYASFLLSYLLTFLIFHSGSAPTPEFTTGPSAMFITLGIPDGVMAVLFPMCLAGYVVSLGWGAVLLLRRASARALLPAAVLVSSQALWFSIPVALRFAEVSVGVEPFRWDLRSYYFFWIALGHCTQYLWITTFYARKSKGWTGYRSYLTKAVVAGAAIWTLPLVLFDPNRVGILPNTTSLALLVAATVNLHHFILDGAIWKLRHSRIASILIRRDTAEATSPEANPPKIWQRRTVWALAAAGCILAFFKYSHENVLFPNAVQRGDFTAARAALDRLDWVSHVSDEARASLSKVEALVGGRRAGASSARSSSAQ